MEFVWMCSSTYVVFDITPPLTPQRMALFQSYMQRVPEGTYFENHKVVEA
jgi:hypothetical protein